MGAWGTTACPLRYLLSTDLSNSNAWTTAWMAKHLMRENQPRISKFLDLRHNRSFTAPFYTKDSKILRVYLVRLFASLSLLAKVTERSESPRFLMILDRKKNTLVYLKFVNIESAFYKDKASVICKVDETNYFDATRLKADHYIFTRVCSYNTFSIHSAIPVENVVKL